MKQTLKYLSISLMLVCCGATFLSAEVTHRHDLAILQAIKTNNDCANVLNWQLDGNRAQGTGITADADGRLRELTLDVAELCGSLNLSDLASLEKLKVNGFGLKTAKLNNLNGLRTLSLSYLSPDNFAFLQQMPEMQALTLDSTGLRDITHLAGMPGLQYADLSYNYIKKLDVLAGLTELLILNLLHNEISDIGPLSVLVKLQTLDLGINHIADIEPLKTLVNLEELALGDNRLKDVEALRHLPLLDYLDLADNYISDLSPLAEIENLTRLNFENNAIRDLTPLKENLERFTLLRLKGNSIPLHQMYDEATAHRWAADQDKVYFARRVQYLPVLDYWVIPHEDLLFEKTASNVRIEGPSGGASFDVETGRVNFHKAGNYKVAISNKVIFDPEMTTGIPVTKSGVISVLDVLPDEFEIYRGREGLVSPAVVNTLYLLLQTYGVVEALDDSDPYYDAIWLLGNNVKPPRLYWQR